MNTSQAPPQVGTNVLAVSTILTGSLPATLATPDAPASYTVDAVFNRKPNEREVAAIRGDDMHAYLSRAGYPRVQTEISDRRLVINNTNLEELRDGLAVTIAHALASISAAVQAQRDVDVAALHELAEREATRGAVVADLVASVSFSAPDIGPEVIAATDHSPEVTPADRTQVSDWNSEGGATDGQ